MKRSLMSGIMSRSVHVLMLLMKPAMMRTAVEFLVLLVVEAVEVKSGHIKTIKRTVEAECRSSREVTVSSSVECKRIIVVFVKEAVLAENVVKVGTASTTVKRAAAKLIVLPAFLLVAQHLVRCSQRNSSIYRHRTFTTMTTARLNSEPSKPEGTHRFQTHAVLLLSVKCAITYV